VAHDPQQNPLGFGGNPDHVTLELWLRLGEGRVIRHNTAGDCVARRFINSNYRELFGWRWYALDWVPF